jgi:CotH kinase protein
VGQFRRRAAIAAIALVGAFAARAVAQVPDASLPGADALFDDTVLHEIRLSINSRDWEALRANPLEDTYYPADLRWRDEVVRNIGVRSRGTGSRSGLKPGLRVDFDRYATGQKFRGTLKSVVLRNNTQDASGLHERISMLFFRRMGVSAPREAHTRLYVNNEYFGLYTIVESVDKAFLNRVNGDDGGYLYKYDYNLGDKPWYFEDRGSDPALYVPSPFKPETHEFDPRPEKIAELVAIVRDGGANFRSTIEPILDPEQFIRHIAIEIFLADKDGFNGDVGMNNFYLYRFENKEMFQFIPWDKSETFKDGPGYSIWRNIEVASWLQNRLTGRLFRYDDLRTRFLDILTDCARSLSEIDPAAAGDTRNWMEREIDREYQQTQAWAALSEPDAQTFSRAAFEQDVENLKTFARQRSEIVLAEVARSRP